MHFHFGLIGYPIKHSLSPFIHDQFLERSGLEGKYSIIEIDPKSNFKESISALKRMKLDGFNITVPFKQTILNHLDELDETVIDIQAVNTVLCKDNRWIGYNTDGIGYALSLEEKYPIIKNNKSVNILIIGAGGAAKGIYHGLRKKGYHSITIANRTVEKAEVIATRKHVLTLEDAEKNLEKFDVIIQTTSVGMKPNINDKILSLGNIKSDTIVSDIVYQPIMTQFLKEAKECGARIHNGHTMLLYQAKYAFEIWTNKEPDISGLDALLENKLEG